MPKNKIIFIGGVPGVGKTSLSGSIARKLGIDMVLSGDYLREFIRPLSMEKNTNEIISTSVYEAWKPFGEKNKDNIIKGFELQSEVMCSGIAAIIERAVKNGENLIVESLYINQKLVETIKKNNVIAAYLYISDFDTHAKRLNEREFYTHFNSPGARLVAQLDAYRIIMDYSVELFKKNGLKVFDNMKFEDTKDELFKFMRQ
ncbi:MAG: AAA family ATPase [Methanothrix sp.]